MQRGDRIGVAIELVRRGDRGGAFGGVCLMPVFGLERPIALKFRSSVSLLDRLIPIFGEKNYNLNL